MKIINKALTKLGKIFKLDAKYFAKSGSYLSATYFTDAFVRLILSIVLARMLTQIDFGQFNFILAVFGTLAFLSLQGTSLSITRSVARGYDAAINEGTKDKVMFSMLGSLSLIVTAIYMYTRGDILLAKVFAIFSLFFIPYFAFVGYESFLTAKRMFREYAIFRSVTSILAVAIALIIAFITRDVLWIAVTLVGVTAILNVVFYIMTLKYKKNENRDNEVIRYGRRLTLITLATTMFINIDKLVITYFLGFKALAIYSVAMVLPRQFKLLVKASVSSVFPGLAVLNKEDSHKIIRKRLRQMIVISMLLSVIGALLAPIAIRIIYGQDYIEAIPYAMLVFAFMWLVIPTVPISEGLLPAQKREKRMLKLNIYTYAIYIILLLILVPRFGLAGAVWSYILDRMFIFVYLTTSLKNIED